MDSISDACMGNDRMDRRNFKSEKMVGKQQDTVNDFWDSFRNFIFFCDGYLLSLIHILKKKGYDTLVIKE